MKYTILKYSHMNQILYIVTFGLPYSSIVCTSVPYLKANSFDYTQRGGAMENLVFNKLAELGIDYEFIEHPAA